MTTHGPDLDQQGPLDRVVPLPPVRLPRPSLLVRFMEKVEIESGGCWLWTAAVHDQDREEPYGWFRHPETRYAHRASHLLFVGPLAPGQHVDHLCRVTLCVNPDHLQATTPRTNIRRASPESWETCGRLHPDTATRLAEKRGAGGKVRLYCKECQRVWAQQRRDRAQSATDGRSDPR